MITVEIKSGNNWIDITKYIKFQGLTFSRNDIESSNAGRDSAGKMHRGRIAIKEKNKISTVPLNNTETAYLHSLIQAEMFQVRMNPYPMTNAQKSWTCYTNNVETSYIMSEGTDNLWQMSFPLVEQ